MTEKEQLQNQLKQTKLSIQSGEDTLEPTDPEKRRVFRVSMDALYDRAREIEAKIAELGD